MHGESRGHKSRKSATQIVKDMICVGDFNDSCPRLWKFRWKSQS